MTLTKTIVKNRKALHDYAIESRLEAGIVLVGSEVKALRLGHGSLVDGYAVVQNGECLLINFAIPQIKHASYMNHSERRQKRLLLHKSELRKLEVATRQKGYTLVPLEVYFDDNNVVKVELALAKGKAQHDKRESEKVADARRDVQRALRR
jgi:SsrA-binding protein